MKFVIEQVAFCPLRNMQAIELLTAMGIAPWVHDTVRAEGKVWDDLAWNEAELSFAYQQPEAASHPALEIEVLHYTRGANWMTSHGPSISHIGMHCSEDDLNEWKEFFGARGIPIAQELKTLSHANPVIAGKRWYHYCIFATRPILGVDVKFIVRREQP